MILNVIIIPIYKENLSETESLSLNRCLTILGKHKICIVTFKQLNISAYRKIIDRHKIKTHCEYFNKKYFTNGTIGYNKLMLSKSFYHRFRRYTFMLIYQLDGYVFRNDMDYWCKKDFSFIGAPVFEGYSQCNSESASLGYMNGGVSLRKTKDMYNILRQAIKIQTFEKSYEKGNIFKKLLTILKIVFGGGTVLEGEGYNEDCLLSRLLIDKINSFASRPIFWKMLFNCDTIQYKMPSFSESYHFSFDENEEHLFSLMKGETPSFCHTFHRITKRKFWSKLINFA